MRIVYRALRGEQAGPGTAGPGTRCKVLASRVLSHAACMSQRMACTALALF